MDNRQDAEDANMAAKRYTRSGNSRSYIKRQSSHEYLTDMPMAPHDHLNH